LITHRFTIEDAPKAYEVITGKTAEPFLGVVITYPKEDGFLNGTNSLSSTVIIHQSASQTQNSTISLGVLGAGNFANATLLPAIKKVAGIELSGIVSSGGVSARTTGDRFGFGYCSTDENKVLNDPNVNLVAILTQHNQHARQVIAALNAGKHVFVEKPLCLNEEELDDIIRVYNDKASKAAPLMMVGFNRRFAPFVLELKKHLQRLQEPVMLNYRVNAGYIPPDHWTQDLTRGGGRLLGEGCHFIDLLIYLSGSKVRRVTTHALPDVGRYANDNLLITLEMVNGSVGTVTYVANGDKGFGKEFIEVFGGGLSARLEDFRTLSIYHGKDRIKKVERLRQDKGHRGEWQAIADYMQGKGEIPISFPQVVHSTEVTLAAQNSLREGTPCLL
jgi:predicted dehydrogenase